MKRRLVLLLCSMGISSAVSFGQGTELPPVKPNDITGTIRFSNANAEIVGLLGDVSKLGPVGDLASAVSSPPFNISSQKSAILAGGASHPYSISVKGSTPGIAYTVYQRLDLGPGDYATQYYFDAQDSPPVLDNDTPVTVDFTECAGLLTINWVNAAGAPVVVKDAQISVLDDPYTHLLAGLQHLPAPASKHSLLALGDKSWLINVTYQVELPGSSDAVSYSEVFSADGVCDGKTEINVTVPSADSLAKALGVFDIVGETEVPLPSYFDTPARSYVSLTGGKGGMTRVHSFPGSPSSGPFELPNILPTGTGPDDIGYKLQGYALLRPGKQFTYFQTPALAEGANPQLKLEASETRDTGNLLTITPGHVTGKVELKGPLPSAGYTPLSKYLLFAWQSDADGDGVPDGSYAGLGGTLIQSEGVDIKAAGADYTAAGGYVSSAFEGAYNDAESLFQGQFDLPLGGLSSQPTIWAEPKLWYELGHGDGTIPEDYVFQQTYIQQKTIPDAVNVPDLTVIAGETKPLNHDLAYALSEVCVRFRSLGDPLWYPRIYGSGQFKGLDYRGVNVGYDVSIFQSFGTPVTHGTASSDALVILYLPEGEYSLQPAVVVANGADDSNLYLETFPLHVGRGERICVGSDITVDVEAPPCSPTAKVTIKGKVNTSSDVVKLTIAGEGGAESVIGENLGANPEFSTEYTLPNTADCGVNTVMITAINANGETASRTVTIRFDNKPPTITCPNDITVEKLAGAELTPVNYTVTATDECSNPVTVVCAPPSGSGFPVGETTVNCTATDACGNQATCSFKVKVTGGGDNLPPVIHCPETITVPCEGSAGAKVEFTVTATDDHDATVTMQCTPASGSVFPVGTTTVTCVATDSAGATSQCSFEVVVKPGEISIRKTVTIEWCGGGTLQYSDDLTGIWTDLPGVTSPYTVDIDEAHRYYRAKF